MWVTSSQAIYPVVLTGNVKGRRGRYREYERGSHGKIGGDFVRDKRVTVLQSLDQVVTAMQPATV